MALRFIREFINLESSSGLILFFAAIAAMILDNTPLSHYYNAFKSAPAAMLLINDGCMSLFFLLVGLEIKRELLQGELNTFSKVLLPAVSAIGGMIFPAAIYLYFNWHHTLAMRGWAIPTATDIAFSLGILSLLGNRIPASLKIFLMALAIFDDIGAIIVIAFFYTTHIALLFLFLSLGLVFILALLNYFNVKKLTIYACVGLLLWFCILKSGVHPTIAGVILALFIPIKNSKNVSKSPLQILEHTLHPWVAFGILPLFAFANAGVSFFGMKVSHFISPIPIGIGLGLFIGKQVGIWLSTIMAVKFKLARLPRNMTRLGLYGISLIAGVGFTMSLFIGTLAFGSDLQHAEFVRVGVLTGSLCSGLLGYFILRLAYRAH
ncbi:MAG: Na+/H+ antiporter NhaA [Gammaproteobacteria bacterium CG_4_10_14_0_8_um_filter_38_16]|nr:MAG: Na+/H+ antiporter NhaA [Gammaproteobacteria bacterium CG_4_10_14_0_8_um_filter_38_16]PJA02796.1 MAG: Na+/H+ antiporter NhaA [Gammaproteobacteria bacterium CG_4_10_14_0_2_um_filter_38_22]PJB10713.1 MAG: Na+/H+ antiporter NhaA [Gammaproteobacteria bacterium CG_4_9_14_3_um_filter_38_9]